jgi:hypothetical protein
VDEERQRGYIEAERLRLAYPAGEWPLNGSQLLHGVFQSMHGGKRPAVRAGEPLRLRESMRRGQPGCVRDARQKPLAQPSAAIAFVPTQRRVQRSVIAVGLGWLALFELRLRTNIGPDGAVGRLVLIAFRCLRLGRAKRLSNSHCVPCLFGTVGCHCPCTHSLAPAGRSGTDD